MMHFWPIGFSTGCFYRRSIFDCLEAIARAGFLSLEISSSREHLDYQDPEAVRRAAGELKRLGLEARSYHAPFGSGVDLSAPDEARRKEATRRLFQAIEAAAILGAPYLVLHPGPEVESTFEPGEMHRRLEHGRVEIDRLARRCRELGMVLLLENLLPHLPLGGAKEILWTLGGVHAPNTGVCLDTGHAFLAGDLYTSPGRYASRLHLVHVSDNGGREDDHLPPGRGRINWRRFLLHLRDADFQGSLVIELSGDGEESPERILAGGREARRHLACCCRDNLKESPIFREPGLPHNRPD